MSFLFQLLTFSIWSFKCQASYVAQPLFSFNVHCRTLFFLSEEKYVHLNEQHCPCPIDLLNVK